MGTATADDLIAGDNLGRLLPIIVASIALFLVPLTVSAQSDGGSNLEQLTEGQQVYSDICSGCHQPTGVGISGSFPPLKDNPHVDDADYVRGVIENGRTGPIEVNGETFDGVMPSFGTLDDDQIAAVIAYLQNDLEIPGATPEPVPGDATTGNTLPVLATTMASIAFLIGLAIALWVLAPRIVGVIDRRNLSRLDAALKGGLIVLYFVLTIAFLPSMLLSTQVIERLPDGVQDFVATSVWVGALGIGILGLWWLQRQDRI